MKIYMDVCCLCRPFDDQQDRKIRLESEAVLAILERCSRDWILVGSDVIDLEISRIADVKRRQNVEEELLFITGYIDLDETIFNRALGFQMAGLRLFDALHLACAETGKTIFLTTDTKIITVARTIPGLSITVENPVHWLKEVSVHEDHQ
jgi:predicted nucleic acid-binding protein